MRDASPCRHAMATRGGDKQEPDAPLSSFPRACRARARNPGFRCRARGIPGSADAARAKRYDSPRGSCTRESPAKRAGSGRVCHYNIQLPIGS